MRNVCILLIALCCSCQSRNRIDRELEGNQLPDFALRLTDSATIFQTRNITIGKPSILFGFGPYCQYSRAQMEEFLKNMGELQNVRIILFTSAPFADMKTFATYYKLYQYTNITIGEDNMDQFGRYFTTPGVPYLAIYDNQNRLKQVLLGKCNVVDIKNALEQ